MVLASWCISPFCSPRFDFRGSPCCHLLDSRLPHSADSPMKWCICPSFHFHTRSLTLVGAELSQGLNFGSGWHAWHFQKAIATQDGSLTCFYDTSSRQLANSMPGSKPRTSFWMMPCPHYPKMPIWGLMSGLAISFSPDAVLLASVSKAMRFHFWVLFRCYKLLGFQSFRPGRFSQRSGASTSPEAKKPSRESRSAVQHCLKLKAWCSHQ